VSSSSATPSTDFGTCWTAPRSGGLARSPNWCTLHVVCNVSRVVCSMFACRMQVRMVLHALTPKLAHVPGSLGQQAIVNILQGCIGISASAERDAFLSALVEKVHGSTARVDGVMLLKTLYGVECAHTDHALRGLMAALATKARAPANPAQPPTLRDAAIRWGTSPEAQALRASLMTAANVNTGMSPGAWREGFGTHVSQIETELRARSRRHSAADQRSAHST
jgi:hypothetical protein